MTLVIVDMDIVGVCSTSDVGGFIGTGLDAAFIAVEEDCIVIVTPINWFSTLSTDGVGMIVFEINVNGAVTSSIQVEVKITQIVKYVYNCTF